MTDTIHPWTHKYIEIEGDYDVMCEDVTRVLDAVTEAGGRIVSSSLSYRFIDRPDDMEVMERMFQALVYVPADWEEPD